jgi:hypothetical protein
LFQQGCNNRAVAQHYLNGLFRREVPDAPAAIPQAIKRSSSRRLEN